MALHKKAEFALLCGFKTATGFGNASKLSIYHGRKKIVYSGDYVDDSIKLNRDFITEWQIKNGVKVDDEPQKPKANPEPKELKMTRPLTKQEMIAEENPELDTRKLPNTGDETENKDGYGAMVLEKKNLEIKKLREEIKKLALGNNKTVGNFVNIDAVKSLIVLFSESTDTAWVMVMDSFVTKIAGKYGLPREELLAMKDEISDTSNTAKQAAIDDTKKKLRRLQTEISNQRGQGERL